MKFTIEAARIVDAVAKIRSVLEAAGATEARFFLLAKNKRLRISGDGQVAQANVDIPEAEVESDFSISCDMEQLLGLIKGRAAMEFSMDKSSVLNIKTVKGRYNASMPTKSTSEDQLRTLDVENGTEGIKLSKELLSALKQGLDMTAITDVYHKNPLNSFIVLKDGMLNISCFDNTHFAQYRSKVKSKRELEVAMPMTYFNAIYKMCGDNAQFDFGSNSLIVSSEDFSMRMPAVNVDPNNFQLVDMLLQTLKAKNYAASCKFESLKKLCNNLFSMFEINSHYTVTCTENEIDVSIKSQRGSASDTIMAKGKGGADFKVDPRLFQDMLNRIKSADKVSLSVVHQKVVFLAHTAENDEYSVVMGSQLSAQK